MDNKCSGRLEQVEVKSLILAALSDCLMEITLGTNGITRLQQQMALLLSNVFPDWYRTHDGGVEL